MEPAGYPNAPASLHGARPGLGKDKSSLLPAQKWKSNQVQDGVPVKVDERESCAAEVGDGKRGRILFQFHDVWLRRFCATVLLLCNTVFRATFSIFFESFEQRWMFWTTIIISINILVNGLISILH